MNGSRVNLSVQKDNLQDYDVVFVVKAIEPFIENKNWINTFGKLAIIQEPDKNDSVRGLTSNFSHSYTFLMLFDDDYRIDLKFINKKYALKKYKSDSLTALLLDKDNYFPILPPPNNSDY